jgi:hypothetical protein
VSYSMLLSFSHKHIGQKVSRGMLIEGSLLPQKEGNQDKWLDTCPTYGSLRMVFKEAFAPHLLTAK